jgi:hypothetical protein
MHCLPDYASELGYAPELNPDELVWNHMKRTGTAKKPLRKGSSRFKPIGNPLRAQRSPVTRRSLHCDASRRHLAAVRGSRRQIAGRYG